MEAKLYLVKVFDDECDGENSCGPLMYLVMAKSGNECEEIMNKVNDMNMTFAAKDSIRVRELNELGSVKAENSDYTYLGRMLRT